MSVASNATVRLYQFLYEPDREEFDESLAATSPSSTAKLPPPSIEPVSIEASPSTLPPSQADPQTKPRQMGRRVFWAALMAASIAAFTTIGMIQFGGVNSTDAVSKLIPQRVVDEVIALFDKVLL